VAGNLNNKIIRIWPTDNGNSYLKKRNKEIVTINNQNMKLENLKITQYAI